MLSFDEPAEMSRGIAAVDTFRAIASRLMRAVSTVSKELARQEGERAIGWRKPKCVNHVLGMARQLSVDKLFHSPLHT